MGNMAMYSGSFRMDLEERVNEDSFVTRNITKSIIYYYTPERPAHSTKDCQKSPVISPSTPHLDPSPDPPPAPPPRPLLVFFSWLGARPGPVSKYRDLYLEKGMDVLLVQSSVMHFLWPKWGLQYGLEVLRILEGPPFSDRRLLIHASSIGGYTFTQILCHIAQEPERHGTLSQRVTGHIYDSLVAGSLQHMAVGLGKTLVPCCESLVRNTALLYFWLFKSHTADVYTRSVQVFYNSPVTAPALFYYCENDALCDPLVMEEVVELWRRRGQLVQTRKWKESTHAAHMKVHPEDYLSALQSFLSSIQQNKSGMIDA